ncbi:toxin-antitoxin system YwqK family antitoxin [Flavivirga sp. 57AJ16]|uniref:toxin-antitoxin system YwqK family antitoxin n=1 Tax=Flavivirga sp. 57AJ16 TaxID=3025307 RepID=UPI0023672644|nr:hypothetical protein [Flavivirga sp. 57AJ16]MDD7885481.1 hypothetical protein [Flavivirga sp. 57AJ16]
MKKLILVLFILSLCKSNSQNIKEIKYSDLDITISEDSAMVFSVNNKLLNGKYKIIHERSTHYALGRFIDGRGEGKSEYYIDGILRGINELQNGHQNGLSITYDKNGEVNWKVEMLNGKKHGIWWIKDVGKEYFIMDKKVSKEEYENYVRINKHNTFYCH